MQEFISPMEMPAISSSNRLGESDQGRQHIVAIQSRLALGEVTVNEVEECIFQAPPKWKRALDVTCIMASLPAVIPLMAIVACWIRLVSRGPIFFLQTRIGRDGRKFAIYKFRSMQMNADTSQHESHVRNLILSNAPLAKLDDLGDPRLIRGGMLLRASGIDELPQLFNVLWGEMSLVGPRPCLPHEYDLYSPAQRDRFKALPGLTGYWQVYRRNCGTFAEMIAIDIDYVRNASFFTDLGIMVRTPWVLALQTCRALQQLIHLKSGANAGMALTKSFSTSV